MKTYEGYDKNMVKDTTFSKQYQYTSALEHNLKVEPTPYLHRTAVSKGTVQTTLGGLPDFKDDVGNTLLTIDPVTGQILIFGAVVANVSLDIGTIAGTTIITGVLSGGTFNNGTLGTPAIIGGTGDAMTLGSPTIIGGNYNTGTFAGTPVITGPAISGGTATTTVLNSNVIGSPTITGGNYNTGTFGGTPVITGAAQTGGSHNSAVFGTPTLQTPTVDGTPNFDVNAGSSALGANGDFAIQTHGTAGVLAIRVGGTTFYFNPTGTI